VSKIIDMMLKMNFTILNPPPPKKDFPKARVSITSYNKLRLPPVKSSKTPSFCALPLAIQIYLRNIFDKSNCCFCIASYKESVPFEIGNRMSAHFDHKCGKHTYVQENKERYYKIVHFPLFSSCVYETLHELNRGHHECVCSEEKIICFDNSSPKHIINTSRGCVQSVKEKARWIE
jgi:hypothetical protein